MNLQPFEHLLHEKMGLDCNTVGSNLIVRFIHQRMAELRMQSEVDYLDLCLSAPDELNRLVSTATVQESWFFRDKGCLPALHARLLELNTRGVHCKILSFPCSTGEEPYSILMGLELLGYDITHLRIDGWDIHSKALETAKTAVYGRNSFRGADLLFRNHYFTEEGNSFHLCSRIKDRVEFKVANAMELPELALHSSFHAIFCRNMLIYLSPHSQKRVLNHLLTLLHPDGVLFVGSSETSLPLNHGMEPVPEKMSFGFNRRSVVPSRKKAPAIRKPAPAPAPRISAVQASPPKPVAAITPEEQMIQATQFADLGKFLEAEKICQLLLSSGVNSARLWNLTGLTADAQGRKDEAWNAYRKALYLDPRDSEALAHLAALAQVLGKTSEASQFQKRLERLTSKS